MSKWWESLLDLLFPPRCVFCQTLLKPGETSLCASCQRELPWTSGTSAAQELEDISLCVSPLWYRDNVRESIRRYKFHDRRCYAKTFGFLTARCVEEHLSGRYDLISWVPLSPKRLRKRGYDQARLLAQAAARELGETVTATLRKVRNTSAQSSLQEDADRKTNVQGVYEVADPSLVKGKRILLFDDVVTTGSTLSECARTLRAQGAEDVVCVTLARARSKQPAQGKKADEERISVSLENKR